MPLFRESSRLGSPNLNASPVKETGATTGYVTLGSGGDSRDLEHVCPLGRGADGVLALQPWNYGSQATRSAAAFCFLFCFLKRNRILCEFCQFLELHPGQNTMANWTGLPGCQVTNS